MIDYTSFYGRVSTLHKLLGRVRHPLFYYTQHKETKAIACELAEHPYELRRFWQFIEQHINKTSKRYSTEELHTNPPEADVYICGSDQVWSHDPSYFLDFVPEGKVRLAYAPSFGGISRFTPEYAARLSYLLGKFRAVSCREQSGVNICHRLGRSDAVKVVDPTLLLTAEDYDRVRQPRQPGRPYLLLYLLGSPIEMKVSEVYDYAAKRGLQVVYVASQGKVDSYPKLYASIGEWIDLTAGAELVVTNSFHSAVFSLIYHRPFVLVPLTGGFSRMNTRTEELLHATGLESRCYRGSLAEVADGEALSFEVFDAYIARERAQSQMFLERGLAPMVEKNS